MITWVQHANNYQMQKPNIRFPFAVWISREQLTTQTNYVVSIYAGEKRIDGACCIDFEKAEQYVIRWFEGLQEQIKALLEIPGLQTKEGDR